MVRFSLPRPNHPIRKPLHPHLGGIPNASQRCPPNPYCYKRFRAHRSRATTDADQPGWHAYGVLHNMIRLGFTTLHERRNWIWSAPETADAG
jgi:hypothetical protein